MRVRLILGVLLVAACSKGEGEKGGGPAATPAPTTTPAPADRRPSDPKADRAAIDKLRAQLVENASAGDIKRITAIYAPDALLLQNFEQSVVGMEQFNDFLRAQFQTASMQFSATPEAVHFVADGLAVEHGRYRSTINFRSGIPPKDDEGHYLLVWQRQPDGGWKVVLDVDKSMVAP